MSHPAARKRHSEPSSKPIHPNRAGQTPNRSSQLHAELTTSPEAAPQNESTIQPQQLPKVSLCTVTYNRAGLLPLLEDCILNQTYPLELLEWVIVDDSDSNQPRFRPREGTGLRSRIISIDRKLALGKKRNLSHDYCDHEIIVCMDDDEYYPPTRVEHAVSKLLESGREVAGATNLPILFIPERTLWMAGPFGENHATANTFAFRRSLLKKTCYEDAATHAEEKAFLRNYTFPMAQLDPKQTLICFGHQSNTYDKRRLIGDGKNPRMRQVEPSTIDDWISSKLIDTYQSAHQLNAGPIQQQTQATTGPSERVQDLDILLLCSPPGSGAELINKLLVKLGSLEIAGDPELNGVIAPRLINLQTLEPIQPAANTEAMLKHFRQQLNEFRTKTPHTPLVLREPYGAPIINSLTNHLNIRLVICLRPMAEAAETMKYEAPSKTASIGTIHRLYGQLFSIITNTDLPFFLLRHHDLIGKPTQTISALVSFAGLAPTKQQLDEASQWIVSQNKL